MAPHFIYQPEIAHISREEIDTALGDLEQTQNSLHSSSATASTLTAQQKSDLASAQTSEHIGKAVDYAKRNINIMQGIQGYLRDSSGPNTGEAEDQCYDVYLSATQTMRDYLGMVDREGDAAQWVSIRKPIVGLEEMTNDHQNLGDEEDVTYRQLLPQLSKYHMLSGNKPFTAEEIKTGLIEMDAPEQVIELWETYSLHAMKAQRALSVVEHLSELTKTVPGIPWRENIEDVRSFQSQVIAVEHEPWMTNSGGKAWLDATLCPSSGWTISQYGLQEPDLIYHDLAEEAACCLGKPWIEFVLAMTSDRSPTTVAEILQTVIGDDRGISESSDGEGMST